MDLLELVEQQKHSIPNAHLVAHFEKEFPIYCIELRVVIRDKTGISILAQFLLRIIGEKIEVASAMASFLGLPSSAIQQGLKELQLLGLIIPVQTPSGNRFKLSTAGMDALEQGKLAKTREDLLSLKMDAITGDIYSTLSLTSHPIYIKEGEESEVIRPCVPNPGLNDLSIRFTELRSIYEENIGYKSKEAVKQELDEIINIKNIYTQYRTLRILMFEEQTGNVRFQVFDRQFYLPEYEKSLWTFLQEEIETWKMYKLSEVKNSMSHLITEIEDIS